MVSNMVAEWLVLCVVVLGVPQVVAMHIICYHSWAGSIEPLRQINTLETIDQISGSG